MPFSRDKREDERRGACLGITHAPCRPEVRDRNEILPGPKRRLEYQPRAELPTREVLTVQPHPQSAGNRLSDLVRGRRKGDARRRQSLRDRPVRLMDVRVGTGMETRTFEMGAVTLG